MRSTSGSTVHTAMNESLSLELPLFSRDKGGVVEKGLVLIASLSILVQCVFSRWFSTSSSLRRHEACNA